MILRRQEFRIDWLTYGILRRQGWLTGGRRWWWGNEYNVVGGSDLDIYSGVLAPPTGVPRAKLGRAWEREAPRCAHQEAGQLPNRRNRRQTESTASLLRRWAVQREVIALPAGCGSATWEKSVMSVANAKHREPAHVTVDWRSCGGETRATWPNEMAELGPRIRYIEIG
jgi:hypothetical protein